MSARMFLTGGAGFLGRHVADAARAAGWEVLAPSSAALDLRDPAAVEASLLAARPAAVVHCAYRKGDAATIVGGSAAVAHAARAVGARLVHVSTDAVFGGRDEPYTEDDVPAPVEPYGRAKAEAEHGVRSLDPGAVLVRTSLLYGTEALSPAQQDVVAALDGRVRTAFFTDEVRSITHAGDLAGVLVALAARPEVTGPLHVAGPDPADRFTFACRVAQTLGRDPGTLRAGTLAASGLVRPGRLVLDCARAAALGFALPRGPWSAAA